MFELLLMIWLIISVFMTFIFCNAARRFGAESDTNEGLNDIVPADNPKVRATVHQGHHNTPYVM